MYVTKYVHIFGYLIIKHACKITHFSPTCLLYFESNAIFYFSKYISLLLFQLQTSHCFTFLVYQVCILTYLSFRFTLFLWDINEQKNCQSFQCGFSYLDSLSNALTARILNSIGWFRICLLNSTANSAQVRWKWAGLAVLFSRQILNQPI